MVAEGGTAVIKVSVITDEIGQDFARALDVSLSLGVRHVELRSLWDENIAALDDEKIEKAKRLLDDRGMKVTAIAGPFFKCHLGPEYRSQIGDTFGYASDESIEEHWKILERSIQLAKVFETDLVRSFAFWRAGAPTPAVYEQIAELLEEAVRRIEPTGLRLALENEHACFIGNASESVEILQRVHSPTLGLIWDPGNAACLDHLSEVFPGGYELIKREIGMERIFHVHLKDPVVVDGRTRFTEFGQGDLDYRGQLEALVQDGYQGAISMETHWRGEDLTQEESTIRSIKGLWRIIDEAGIRQFFE